METFKRFFFWIVFWPLICVSIWSCWLFHACNFYTSYVHLSYCYSKLLFIYSFYLKGREIGKRRKRDRETDTKRVPICWFTHQMLTTLTWARSKSGAHNSIQVSSMGGRDPTTWTITCYFPGYTLEESWNGEQREDSNPGTWYGMWLSQMMT